MSIAVVSFLAVHLRIHVCLTFAGKPVCFCGMLFKLVLPFACCGGCLVCSCNSSRGVRLFGPRLSRLGMVPPPMISFVYSCVSAAFPTVLAPDQHTSVVHDVSSRKSVLVYAHRCGLLGRL